MSNTFFKNLPSEITEDNLNEIVKQIYEDLNNKPLTSDDKMAKISNELSDIDQSIEEDTAFYNPVSVSDDGRIKKIDHHGITRGTFNNLKSKDNIEKKLKECLNVNVKDLEKLKANLARLNKKSDELGDDAKKPFRYWERLILRNTLNSFTIVKNWSNISEIYSGFNPEDIKLYPNLILANELNRIFKNMITNKKNKYESKGRNLSITKFIQSKFTGNNKIFRADESKINLTLDLIIDMSGSMKQEIHEAVNMIATIFKSVESIKGIKINVFGFESSNIYEVKKYEDLKNICVALGSTPTGNALTYYKSQINYNEKHLMILLSDGIPNSLGRIDVNDYLSMLIDELNKKHVATFGFLLGVGNFEAFVKIFGQNFIECNSIKQATPKIIQTFKSFVARNLRI